MDVGWILLDSELILVGLVGFGLYFSLISVGFLLSWLAYSWSMVGFGWVLVGCWLALVGFWLGSGLI